MAVFSSVCW